MNRQSAKNILKVFVSNLTIIISGIIVGFILPKILGVTEYGYYKIFSLYITYTVLFDLGIANGVYLKYGGYYLKDLPQKKFRAIFRSFLILQIVIAIIISLIATIFLEGEYVFIFLMLAVYAVFNNIANYFEKISIMTGEFDATTKRNILKSILTICSIVILYILTKISPEINKYQAYTVLFVIIYAILGLQYMKLYKQLILGKKVLFKNIKPELIQIIKIGFVLLLADITSSLVLTLDRQFVSVLYDVDTYSVYSFAYSMLKIITLAISAVAIVFYPSLKRMTTNKLKDSYKDSLAIITIIAFACLLAYYPLCEIVTVFLSDYTNSLEIFRVLFPSIAISSIISIVINNHYKALNQSKKYFFIAQQILILSIIANIFAHILLHKPIGFAIASVLVMFVWYMLSNYKLKKQYDTQTNKQTLFLLINIVLFYCISGYIENKYLGLGVNALLYLVMSYIFFGNEIRKTLHKLKRKGEKI